jgi:hypothetical protein
MRKEPIMSLSPVRSLLISCLALPVLLSGCLWVPSDDFDFAVWSDDGEEAAFVQRDFMAQNRFTHTKERNHTLQVYTAPFDQVDVGVFDEAPRDTLGQELEGNIRSLYYMRSAGYVLVSRQVTQSVADPDSTPEPTTWAYDRLAMDGTTTTVAELSGMSWLQCESEGRQVQLDHQLQLIPSPDGSVLAQVEALVSCEGPSPTETVTMSFLSAETLQAIGTAEVVDLAALELEENVMEFLDLGWLADGTFMIQGDGVTAWAAVPGTAGAIVDPVDSSCLEPRTTSGEFRDDGMRVWIDSDGTLNFAAEDESSIFGCDDR